jgi:hypothetical protein
MGIAVETASPRLQKEIKKFVDLAAVESIVSYLAPKKIFLNGFFMLGFPGETLSEMIKTIRFALRSKFHSASFFVVHAFKGSEIERWMKERNRDVIPGDSRNEYYNMVSHDTVNCSDLSGGQLQAVFSIANILFYCNPVRVFRFLRRAPNRRVIRFLIFQFFLRSFFWVTNFMNDAGAKKGSSPSATQHET